MEADIWRNRLNISFWNIRFDYNAVAGGNRRPYD
jgi:hypothetical protein